MKEGHVVVTERRSIDAIRGEHIEAFMRGVFPEDDPELDAMLESMTVEQATELEVVVNATSGWPTRWRSQAISEISIGDEVKPGGHTTTVECTRLGEG